MEKVGGGGGDKNIYNGKSKTSQGTLWNHINNLDFMQLM